LHFGEFDDEKKFASFSPEFLVLTRTSPVLQALVEYDDSPSFAPGLLKTEKYLPASIRPATGGHIAKLEHDPEKWRPVFRKYHA
jgi:hypothetical protein